MNSGFFKLKWRDLAGAIVSTALVAIIGLILQTGDIFIVDWKQAVNVGIIAGLGSLLKSLLTTQDGDFVGAVPVK